VTSFVQPVHLTDHLGGMWHRYYGVAPCPVCQGERRRDQNALTVNAKNGKLLLHCKKNGCDFKDILIAAGITPGSVDIDALAVKTSERGCTPQKEKLKSRARALWEHGETIHGTQGERYLRARGITCALPDSLRWLPDTYHSPSGNYCAAMIADVAPTGGVHRTFFIKNGPRLKKSAKMMLGPCSGGAVGVSVTNGPLVVCEGIETGLSLLSGLLIGPHTVWAALSTSGIRGLSLPSQVGELIIATDSDDGGAGEQAGNALAHSAHASGWTVSLLPAPLGMDWNDALRSKGVK
jgi:hypothetical protein